MCKVFSGRDTFDLAFLRDVAFSTFGNFTTVLRSFLNVYYNIRLDPPHALTQYSLLKKNQNVEQKDYVVIPNPIYDCFHIVHKLSTENDLEISIINLDGRVVFNKLYKENSDICIKDKLIPGIYQIKINNKMTSKISNLKILII